MIHSWHKRVQGCLDEVQHPGEVVQPVQMFATGVWGPGSQLGTQVRWKERAPRSHLASTRTPLSQNHAHIIAIL